MELPIFVICLVLCTTTVIAQPINTYVLPKEYYQRQNLPEIPGYIPVYIKHDDEPLPKWKDDVNTHSMVQKDEKPEETFPSAEVASTESQPVTPQVQSIPETKGKGKKASDKTQSQKFKEPKE